MAQREIIYGVCDKTGSCDSYFGFFKTKEGAEHEVQVQAGRLKEDLGWLDIQIQSDRALMGGKSVVVIHSYVIR
jgi:hypothetical protein